jgi:hypothetical protein
MTITLINNDGSVYYKQYDYSYGCGNYTPVYSYCKKNTEEKQLKAIMAEQKRRSRIVEEKSNCWLCNALGIKNKKLVKEYKREIDTVERSYFTDGTMISKTTSTNTWF